MDWTDTRNSGCTPGTDPTSCQSGKSQIFFACQTSGLGIHGEVMTGCGQSNSLSPQIVEVPWAPALLFAAAIGVGVSARRLRNGRQKGTPSAA